MKLEETSLWMLLSGKGEMSMTYLEAIGLLGLLGGAIVATFEITWKIATRDTVSKKKDNKKD